MLLVRHERYQVEWSGDHLRRSSIKMSDNVKSWSSRVQKCIVRVENPGMGGIRL